MLATHRGLSERSTRSSGCRKSPRTWARGTSCGRALEGLVGTRRLAVLARPRSSSPAEGSARAARPQPGTARSRGRSRCVRAPLAAAAPRAGGRREFRSRSVRIRTWTVTIAMRPDLKVGPDLFGAPDVGPGHEDLCQSISSCPRWVSRSSTRACALAQAGGRSRRGRRAARRARDRQGRRRGAGAAERRARAHHPRRRRRREDRRGARDRCRRWTAAGAARGRRRPARADASTRRPRSSGRGDRGDAVGAQGGARAAGRAGEREDRGPARHPADVDRSRPRPARADRSRRSLPPRQAPRRRPHRSGHPPRPAGERTEERVRMSKRRATIARRLVEAQHTAAMLTTFNEVDMTAVMALRERQKETFKDEARRRPRHRVVLRQGGRRGAARVSAAQRRDPGRRDGAQALLRHRHRRRRRRGPGRAGPARRRPHVVRRHRDWASASSPRKAKDGR